MNKTGIEIIAKERKRQIEVEGWNSEHDDEHINGELSQAAACYALPEQYRVYGKYGVPLLFPCWNTVWWKPSPWNRITELAKAGALIAAEIDRLQRNDYLSKVEHISPHVPLSEETKEVLNKVVEQAYKTK